MSSLIETTKPQPLTTWSESAAAKRAVDRLTPAPRVIKTWIGSFLLPKEIINFQMLNHRALIEGNSLPNTSSLIIQGQDLQPLINRYLPSCQGHSARKQTKGLHQLMSLCHRFSRAEEIPSPSYQSLKFFFGFIITRNCINLLKINYKALPEDT